MKKNRILKLTLTMLLVLVLVVGMFAGCEQEIETPTPTPTPTVKPTPEPTPTVDPTPTPTPSKGGIVVTLPDNPTPSKKYVDAAGVAGLSGGGTYYLEDVTSSDVVSLTNADFTGKLFIGNLDAPAKAVTVNLPKATVEVTGIVNAGAFDVTTSENTFKLNGATLNVSSLKISGGNVEIAKSTVSGAMEIPVGNTTMTKMTVTGSTLGAVTININSAIEVAMKDSPVASVTNNNTAVTTLKVSGTTTVAVENTSSAKIAVAVESGSKPSIDLKNDNTAKDSCDVQIPQNDATAPDINVSGTGVDKIVITDEGNDTPITEITTAPAGVQFVGAAETTFIYSGKVYKLTPETNINEAIAAAAAANEVIHFVGNVTVEANNSITYVALDKPLTFNFNGKTIDAGFYLTEGSQGSVFKNGTIEVANGKHYLDETDAPIIGIQNNGTTTIENMTLKSASGNLVEVGIVIAPGVNAEVIVKNTTIKIDGTSVEDNGSSVDDNINGIYLNAGKVSIDGLTLNLTAKTGFKTFGVTYTVTDENVASITKFANVTGTDTLNAYLRIYCEGSLPTAEEIKAQNLLTKDQIWAIRYSDDFTVFRQLGMSLVIDSDSLTAAMQNGGTVKLLNDFEFRAEGGKKIEISKDVDLDLNGKTIKIVSNSISAGIFTVNAGKTLTITSSSSVKGKIIGRIFEERNTGSLINTIGTLNLENVIIETTTNQVYPILVNELGTLNVKDKAEILAKAGSTLGIGIATNGANANDVTINIYEGAKVYGDRSAMYVPKIAGNGSLNIYGGLVEGVLSGIEMRAGTLNMTGGEIKSSTARAEDATTQDGTPGDVSGALVLVKSQFTTATGYNGAITANLTGGKLTNANGDALVAGKEAILEGTYPEGAVAVTIADAFVMAGNIREFGEDITIGNYKDNTLPTLTGLPTEINFGDPSAKLFDVAYADGVLTFTAANDLGATALSSIEKTGLFATINTTLGISKVFGVDVTIASPEVKATLLSAITTAYSLGGTPTIADLAAKADGASVELVFAENPYAIRTITVKFVVAEAVTPEPEPTEPTDPPATDPVPEA